LNDGCSLQLRAALLQGVALAESVNCSPELRTVSHLPADKIRVAALYRALLLISQTGPPA